MATCARPYGVGGPCATVRLRTPRRIYSIYLKKGGNMPEYIRPVDNDALARARAKAPAGSAPGDLGAIDASSKEVIAAEHEYIEQRRAYSGFIAQPARRHAALALSGGGIRSASFALGVMQRLAKDDYLRLFDYLSTVSGGGYIGCSLTWLTSVAFRTLVRPGLRIAQRRRDIAAVSLRQRRSPRAGPAPSSLQNRQVSRLPAFARGIFNPRQRYYAALRHRCRATRHPVEPARVVSDRRRPVRAGGITIAACGAVVAKVLPP